MKTSKIFVLAFSMLTFFFISCEKDSDDLPAPAPLSCGNGIQDADEEGIDCGGVCGLPCDRGPILPDPTNTTPPPSTNGTPAGGGTTTPTTGGGTTTPTTGGGTTTPTTGGGTTTPTTGGGTTTPTTGGGTTTPTTGGGTTTPTTGGGTTTPTTNADCPFFPLATMNAWEFLSSADNSTSSIDILSPITVNGIPGFSARTESSDPSNPTINWEATCNNGIIDIPSTAFGIDNEGVALGVLWDFNLPVGGTYQQVQVVSPDPDPNTGLVFESTITSDYEIISTGGGTRTVEGTVFNDIFQINVSFTNEVDFFGTITEIELFDIQYYFSRDIGLIQQLVLFENPTNGTVTTQGFNLTSFSVQ